MKLITQKEASLLDYAPSLPGINKKLKAKKVPKFFVENDGKMMVNIQHPEWVALINRRMKQEQKGNHPGSSPEVILKRAEKEKNPDADNGGKIRGKGKKSKLDTYIDSIDFDNVKTTDMEELVNASQVANLREQILKNEKLSHEISIKQIELNKKSKNIIDISLAEFLYFGYMEKIGIELLMMTKKLRDKIEAKVQDNDSPGILKLIDREIETILREVKKAQKDDLEKWRKED